MTLRASRIATLSTGAYALGQAADLATTYWLSPVLDRETNLAVAGLEWGWLGMVSFAVAATVLMLIIQGWMWRRLLRLLPGRRMGYQQLYRILLLGDSRPAGQYHFPMYAAGVLMGVVFVVTYAGIASKWFAAGWNLSLWKGWVDYVHPMAIRVAKNTTAAGVGLFAFFVCPYWLNRRISRAR